MAGLNDQQRDRYRRHLLLEDVGEKGQERLLAAKVLVVGAGGLGSPVLLYLAAAGIGTLGIVDYDRVDVSNLQRQIIHCTPDVGRLKVQSAADKLHALNPEVRILPQSRRLDAGTIGRCIRGYDFVVDCTDDFTTKFLINDACVAAGIPFSHGGILRFVGQTMTIRPGKSACYRCVFGNPPPPEVARDCSRAGVFGAVAGILGALQATEVIKYLLDVGTSLADTLLTVDALSLEVRKVAVRRRPDCAACGENKAVPDGRG